MRIPKQLTTIVVAAVVGGVVALGTGAAIEAGATGSATTYSGCLSSKGALSKVTTGSPTCPTGTSAISWNAQGPQGVPGTTGLTGAPGPAGPTGPAATTCQAIPGPNASYVGCVFPSGVFWQYLNMTGVDAQNIWANGSVSNFTGATLINANFNYGYFGSANFTNADLTGATLSGATATGSPSFNHANLTNAVLTGFTSYAGISFFNANLTGAVLTGAAAINGNMNFTNANLTGAVLTGAAASGGYSLIFTGATCPNGIVFGTAGANCT